MLLEAPDAEKATHYPTTKGEKSCQFNLGGIEGCQAMDDTNSSIRGKGQWKPASLLALSEANQPSRTYSQFPMESPNLSNGAKVSMTSESLAETITEAIFTEKIR